MKMLRTLQADPLHRTIQHLVVRSNKVSVQNSQAKKSEKNVLGPTISKFDFGKHIWISVLTCNKDFRGLPEGPELMGITY